MTPAQIRDLVKTVAGIPVPWILVVVPVALLTGFRWDRAGDGEVAVEFGLGGTALVALSLIWLPMVLKLVGVVGGSVKGPGLEAALSGVLGEADAIDLGTGVQQIVVARSSQERESALLELKLSVDRLTSPVLQSSDPLSEEAVNRLARSYEDLRRQLPPGSTRTSAMTKIVSEANFRASRAPSQARSEASRLLRSPAQGDRIVGLGFAQATGDPLVLDDVIRLVTGSATAFEMYHALLALQELSEALSAAQRENAVSALKAELNDPRSVGIAQDNGLTYLLPRTIDVLVGRE